MISAEQREELLTMAEAKADVFARMHTQGIHVWDLISKELYSDPTHCIFELLQNAEDEKAASVTLALTDDLLTLRHDGRAFSHNDIKAICSVGDNPEKREKRNTIGRFGIGFKSVYSVTECPVIRSAGVQFSIKNFIVPDFTFDVEDDGTTTIILPFGKDKTIARKRRDLLDHAVRAMDHQHLLFLSNITRIEWSILGETTAKGVLERSAKRIKDSSLHTVRIQHQDKEQVFVVGERPVKQVNKDLSVKIAFPVIADEGAKDLTPPESAPLFAFFPTAIESGLPFLLHAPFLTTPARDNLQKDDAGSNEWLYGEAFELLTHMVNEVLEVKLPTKALWDILPCDKQRKSYSEAYAHMYSSLARRAKAPGTKWIRCRDGKHNEANHVVLSGANAVAGLLDEQDCASLFKRDAWTSGNTRLQPSPAITFFKHELGIPVVGWDELREALTPDFLATKSDDWLIRLYTAIAQNGKPGDWKTTAIIRLRDGSITAAFDKDEKPRIFLPSKGSTLYPSIKESLASDPRAKSLFTAMGLRRPNVVDEVNELIIPLIEQHDQPFPDLPRYILTILRAVSKATGNEKERLLTRLRSLRMLPATTARAQAKVLAKAAETYFPSHALVEYFAGDAQPIWLDVSALPRVSSLRQFRDLLATLGLRGQPARSPLDDSHLTAEELNAITGSHYRRSVRDHQLVNLAAFLSTIKELERSQCLWNVLLGKDSPGKERPEELLQGRVDWEHWSRKHTKSIPSAALDQLRSSRWLCDQQGTLHSPLEISIHALHPAYDRTSAESLGLIQILGFKADAISAFEEEFDVKVVSKEEYAAFLEFKQRQEQEMAKEQAAEQLMGLLDVSSVDGDEIVVEEGFGFTMHGEVESPGVLVQPGTATVPVLYRVGPATNSLVDEPISTYQSGIGRWGEDFVKRMLQKQVANDPDLELVDLNADGNTGVGCDLRLLCKGEIKEVIEVKTTTEEPGSPLKVSGIQWETAGRYHERGEGEKYCLYCVYRANTRRPAWMVVRDPVKWYKEGRLRFQDLLVIVPS